MNHWLLKTEPSSWSWDQQVEVGEKGTFWSGVRNHAAKQNLQSMKKGDRGFFYHSGEGKEIVGVVEVIKEYYPDHTDKSGIFGMVDVKAVAPMPKAVTLQAIKAEPKLKDMALVKFSRLSVQPVTPEEWRIVCRMAISAWKNGNLLVVTHGSNIAAFSGLQLAPAEILVVEPGAIPPRVVGRISPPR
jgi:predicted RNA-binding protein with PUA-like domain